MCWGPLLYLKPGEILHEPEDAVRIVYFILHGRLKAVKIDARGQESLLRIAQRGDQLGMMVGALHDPVPVRVFALEPSTVLALDYEQAMDLTLSHLDLRRQWLRTYAGTARRETFGAVLPRGPSMLALLHEDSASRQTAENLLVRLAGMGEKLAVFSDWDEAPRLPGIRFRSLGRDGLALTPEETHQQVAQWQDATRIVFNVQAGLKAEHAVRLMEICDRAVYFVPHHADASCALSVRRTGENHRRV